MKEFAATVVEPDDIFQVEADIFAPCALGGVINDDTVPKLRVEIVVGSANNQLLSDAHGDALAARNILFAPDYVANAGGIINGCRELLDWDENTARNKVNETYDRMEAILELAKRQDIPPFRAATHLAKKLLNN
jgi:leucine dehydrogenase